ncbi:MAG: hypothetical protein R3Y24_13390 [Eubacteriales bacterium]
MARKSAKILCQLLGLTAKEFNFELELLGYLKKSQYVTRTGSSKWDLTEKGKQFGEYSSHPYSYGAIWDEEVVDHIKNQRR